jgi:hypothetical protein
VDGEAVRVGEPVRPIGTDVADQDLAPSLVAGAQGEQILPVPRLGLAQPSALGALLPYHQSIAGQEIRWSCVGVCVKPAAALARSR